MQRHHWKRVLVGWLLVSMLLSAPAAAQYCYGGCSGGDDDGFSLKPWMIPAVVAQFVLGGGLEGCTPDGSSEFGSP